MTTTDRTSPESSIAKLGSGNSLQSLPLGTPSQCLVCYTCTDKIANRYMQVFCVPTCYFSTRQLVCCCLFAAFSYVAMCIELESYYTSPVVNSTDHSKPTKRITVHESAAMSPTRMRAQVLYYRHSAPAPSLVARRPEDH